MSDWQAIAAVTATLRDLLDPAVTDNIPVELNSFDLGSTTVTTRAPGKARTTTAPQLNLFLYSVAQSEAWRNIDMQESLRRTGAGGTPLALDLFYLLTAYGRDDNDIGGNFLLARAMRIFHDNPVLDRDLIKAAMPTSNLHEQIERVRITTQPMSIEEISKLWSAFNTDYRVSTAYQVSVVLIESRRPTRTPLPVLKRGELDRGPAVLASMIPPYPILTGLSVPGRQPAARAGDTLTLTGHNLAGTTVRVHLVNERLGVDVPLAPLAGATSTPLSVTIPTPATTAGIYAVHVKVTKGTRVARTNDLPLTVAPTLVAIPPGALVPGAPPVLTLTTVQDILAEQRVYAVVGDLEFPANPHVAATKTLTFNVPDVPAGPHHVRLRVDGVDSFIVKYDSDPPAFDDDFKVTFP
jgi:hypothetical protein